MEMSEHKFPIGQRIALPGHFPDPVGYPPAGARRSLGSPEAQGRPAGPTGQMPPAMQPNSVLHGP